MGAIHVPTQRVSSVGVVQGTVNGTITGWFRLAVGGVVRRAMGCHGLFECRTDGGTAILHEFLQDGASPSFTMTLGVLYHFAFTWDQPSTTKAIYVDGVLNTENTSATFPGTPGTGTWSIGDRATFGQGWSGYLDDIRWYTRTLSSAEIATIFAMRNTQDGVARDVLFRHWGMQDGPEGIEVVRFLDLTGNQNLTVIDGIPDHANEAGIITTQRAA